MKSTMLLALGAGRWALGAGSPPGTASVGEWGVSSVPSIRLTLIAVDSPPFILAGSQENFAELVLENSRRGPVLVDFWSPRVGPSLRQRDLLVRLAQAYGGRFLLVSVDTDRERGLVAEYGVRSLPSCKLFRQGRLVEQVFGLQPEAHYRALIDRHLPGVAEGVTAAALQAWNAGDREGALRLLAEGALADPQRPELPLLLAKLLMRLGRQGEAQALLSSLPELLADRPEIRRLHGHLDLILAAETAPTADVLTKRLREDPQDPEARFQLAARRLVADEVEGALEELLALMERAPDYREGVAERALAALLDLLDPQDERVRRYRRALMNRHA